MKNKQIYFCNKKSTLLDYETVTDLIKQIKFKLKFNFEKQKEKSLKNNENDLIKNPYLATFDTKGTKFLLYLTIFQRRKYCLFIDYTNVNKLKIYSIKFRFSNDLYKGTLLDGEIVMNDKKSWIYLITDIYYEEGNNVKYNKFSEKLQQISNILKSKYKYDDFMNVCHIQMKSYFLYSHFEILKNKNINNNTKYDVLFIPENFREHRLKVTLTSLEIKEDIKSTIELFEIKKTETPDVYKLYKDNQDFVGIACIAKLQTSLFVRNLFNNNNEKSIIVKCNYSKRFDSWIPIEKISTRPSDHLS